jgi:hypothetical protein
MVLLEYLSIPPQKEGFSQTLFTFAPTRNRCLVSFEMQRLFSMFPLGAAGIALMLLRISAAGTLLTISFPQVELPSSEWAFGGLAVLAAFLLLGVFTPAICTLCCVLEIALLISLHGRSGGLYLLFSIVDTAALGLLGPGGYSLDARMFGRRRVVLSSDDSSDIG